MNNKARKLLRVLVYALYIGLCLITSYYVIKAIGSQQKAALQTIPFVLCLIVSLWLHNILHVCGHWMMGRLSGMQLIAITFLKRTHVKEGNKFQTRQELPESMLNPCLMVYPLENARSKRPSYTLYWLGGVILNAFTALAALLFILSLHMSLAGFGGCFCISLFVSGLGYTIMNGLPMYHGAMPNDLLMALQMQKYESVNRAFTWNMQLLATLSKGDQVLECGEPYMAPYWVGVSQKIPAYHSTWSALWLRQYEFHMWKGQLAQAGVCLRLLYEQYANLPDSWKMRLDQECVFWLSWQRKEPALLHSFMTPERIKQYEEQASAEAWRCLMAWYMAIGEEKTKVRGCLEQMRTKLRTTAFRPAAAEWGRFIDPSYLEKKNKNMKQEERSWEF